MAYLNAKRSELKFSSHKSFVKLLVNSHHSDWLTHEVFSAIEWLLIAGIFYSVQVVLGKWHFSIQSSFYHFIGKMS